MAHPILTEKTTIEDMEIGDCIPCRYKAPVSGAVGEFSELGTCTAPEIPKEGNVATPDGKFYFIKADKGLLIADRVVQTNILWRTLNDAGLIDGVNPNRPNFTKLPDPSGLPTGDIFGVSFSQDDAYLAVCHATSPYITIYKKSGGTFDIGLRVRSLSGGVIYADENGNPTFTDSLCGAFPTNNEYDTYIKKSTLDGKITAGDNSIWNYGKCFSLTKGAPVIGTWVNRGGVSTVTTNLQRMIRGNDNRTDGDEWKDVNVTHTTGEFSTVGFRPVLEFIEPDSLQENAYY